MKTTINVRVNKELKKATQELAESVGVSVSELINSYLIQVAVTGRVDFFSPVMENTRVKKDS